jgi:hypothetical protein
MRMQQLLRAGPLGEYANFVINFCQIIFGRNSNGIAAQHKEPAMRVSDDRYARDRQRYDLAERLIRHEARTYTIRQWTGLSDDRIRKLYRSYLADHGSHQVQRHRGKSPRQTSFFFRNSELTFQAAQLASLFVVYGLMGGTQVGIESHYRLGSLESGNLLCETYESYVDFHSPASISFEHAWFLLIALTRRDELSAVVCSACGGMHLRDRLSKRRLDCPNCLAWRSPGAAV